MLGGRPSHLRSRVNLLEIRKVRSVAKGGVIESEEGSAGVDGEGLAIAGIGQRTGPRSTHHRPFLGATAVSGA
jgi:hypothetical protein